MSDRLRIALSAGALERLIGGDTEIEVEIRNGAAQAFAKANLRSALEENVRIEINQFKAELTHEIRKEISKWVEPDIVKRIAWNQTTLTDSAAKMVRDLASRTFAGKIEECVTSVIETLMAERIKEMVQASIDRQTGDLVNKLVAQRLKEVIKLVDKP